MSDKYDLTEHPMYRYTADANPRYAFHVESYLNRDLKLASGEEYDVVEADASNLEE